MIDVLTPIRAGEPVRGDVIASLLSQTIALAWHVAAGPDRALDAGEREVIEMTSSGEAWAAQHRHMVPIVAKRNRLASAGRHPFVLLFDADVILPTPSLLEGVVRAFERFPALGASGACYHVDWPYFRSHLGCGCMLMRREIWQAIQPLRGAACECFMIRASLAAMGLRTVPLDIRRLHAHQWKRSDPATGQSCAEAACPLCGRVRNPAGGARPRFEVDVSADGEVDVSRLRRLVNTHGHEFEARFVAPR